MEAPKRENATENEAGSLAQTLVGLFLILSVALSGAAIIAVHMNLFSVLASDSLLRAHAMCGGFGMLGASLAATRKYYRTRLTAASARANGRAANVVDWRGGWLYYYCSRPTLGAVLGALSYTLSFIGFQVLANPDVASISARGRFVLYGVSFLSGFAVSHVLDRLESLAEKIFQVFHPNPKE